MNVRLRGFLKRSECAAASPKFPRRVAVSWVLTTELAIH